ncbi:MAG: DUF5652 family protein [Patescibacteria group bacterium]
MDAIFTQSGLGDAIANHFGTTTVLVAVLLAAVTLWSLAWKGVALWFSARNHQKAWFVVMLIVNTLGILEIIYLLFFRRDKQPGATKSLFNNPLPDETDAEVASAP